MGFYAKGSPGSFLHLTESSDARNGIAQDTIFHSSMPHIFIEQEWETTLRGVDSRWHGTNNGNQDRVFNAGNPFPYIRLGDIPAGAIAAIKDPAVVVMTEIEFTRGGKTFTKIINGWSLRTNHTRYYEDDWESEWGDEDWSTNLMVQSGMGVTLGYYVGGAANNPRLATKNGAHYGVCSAKIHGWASGDINSRDFNAYAVGYATELGGSRITIDTTKFPPTTSSGLQVNTVAVFPFPYLWGDSRETQLSAPSSSDATENAIVNQKLDNRTPRWVFYNTTIPFPSRGDGQWAIGSTRDWTSGQYGQTGRYTDIVITKVRWKKLSLRYSATAGYSASPFNSGEGVFISGTAFKVGNTDLRASGKKMLHQLNALAPGANKSIMYCNPHMDSITIAQAKPYMPALGVASDKSITAGPGNKGTAIAIQGHNYLSTVDFSRSSGWYCKPDEIGDNYGVIWGRGGALPLRMFSGSTRIFTIPSVNNNPWSQQLITTVDLGLSTTRPTTVVYTVNSKDIFMYLPGESYYYFRTNGTGNTLKLSSTTVNNVGSDHSILVLPINKFVPFIWQQHQNADLDDGSGYVSLFTIIYWFRNLGNGKLEVWISNRNDAEQRGGYPVKKPNKTPVLSVSIAKLS